MYAITYTAMALGAIFGWALIAAIAFAAAIIAEGDYVQRRRKSLRNWARGLDVRTARRLPLVVAALASLPTRTPLVALAITALVTLTVIRFTRSRTFQMDSNRQIRALGGLDIGLDRLRECEALARRRDTIDLPLRAFEAAVALVLTIVAEASLPGVTGLVVLVVVGGALVAFTARTFLRIRRMRPIMLTGEHNAEIIEAWAEYDPQVIVYYNGHPRSMYGLEAWLPALEATGYRVGVVCRHRTVRRLTTTMPGVRVLQDSLVERFVTPSTRIALYPANGTLNVHLQRDSRLVHCFIGHGDSDKAGSASPVTRSYNEVWVAGEAAVDRYRAAGVDIAPENFVRVGRPALSPVVRLHQRNTTLAELATRPDQVDSVAVFKDAVRLTDTPKVMYAPTWEGYFEESNYSSLALFAAEIASSELLDPARYDLLFRPHPMSGHRSTSLPRTISRLRAAIRTAHGDERGPELYRHTDIDIVEWFDVASVLVADVSSVVSDWLAWDRPLILTNPTQMPLEDFYTHFPTARAAYVVASGEEMVDMIRVALGDDPLQSQRRDVRERYLGPSSDPFERFCDAFERHLGPVPERVAVPTQESRRDAARSRRGTA